MAKRVIKSLGRTGRVDRKKARAVAKQLHAEIEAGEIEVPRTLDRSTTASGRAEISFRGMRPDPEAPSEDWAKRRSRT